MSLLSDALSALKEVVVMRESLGNLNKAVDGVTGDLRRLTETVNHVRDRIVRVESFETRIERLERAQDGIIARSAVGSGMPLIDQRVLGSEELE